MALNRWEYSDTNMGCSWGNQTSCERGSRSRTPSKRGCSCSQGRQKWLILTNTFCAAIKMWIVEKHRNCLLRLYGRYKFHSICMVYSCHAILRKIHKQIERFRILWELQFCSWDTCVLGRISTKAFGPSPGIPTNTFLIIQHEYCQFLCWDSVYAEGAVITIGFHNIHHHSYILRNWRGLQLVVATLGCFEKIERSWEKMWRPNLSVHIIVGAEIIILFETSPVYVI